MRELSTKLRNLRDFFCYSEFLFLMKVQNYAEHAPNP